MTEAADLIIKGIEGAINAKTVTYDFHRMMDGPTEVNCSDWGGGDAIIKHMGGTPTNASKPKMAMARERERVACFSQHDCQRRFGRWMVLTLMSGLMVCLDGCDKPDRQLGTAVAVTKSVNSITLTERAAAAVGDMMTAKSLDPSTTFLRVGVTTGGSTGFMYVLDLTQRVQAADLRLKSMGVVIVVDPEHMLYLNGTSIDYEESERGVGFVFNNPNAMETPP